MEEVEISQKKAVSSPPVNMMVMTTVTIMTMEYNANVSTISSSGNHYNRTDLKAGRAVRDDDNKCDDGGDNLMPIIDN